MDSLELSNISSSSSSVSVDRRNKGNRQVEEDALFAARLAEGEAMQDRDCNSDATLASILQRQFDLEYDSHLKKQEDRLNGQSKVGISLDKFKRATNPGTTVADSHKAENGAKFYDSDELYLEEKFDPDLAWDVFEQSEIKRRSRMMGRSGFVLDEDGNMITKHDIPTSSRKNMCRLMESKTDIQTGDAGASKDDFKITNYVYNKLKVYSKKNSRRELQRLCDKKERENSALLEDIRSCKMSDATRAIMDGLLIAFKIEKLNGVIGHGKESIVLHATGKDHEDTPGKEVAVKIFKSNKTMSFKTRDTYNKSKCPSYKFDKPRSKNESLNKWAERGFKNLKLLRKANINCPDAISLKKHVLLMTFLGTDASPSPQLKVAQLDECQLRCSYKQVVDIMERMYKCCHLIHGDLSEYNLLWHNNQVYVIDVSQSMFTSHPNANIFLFRDCKNIVEFYKRSKLADILDEKSLFTHISGKDLTDNDVELLAKIEDFPRNEKLMDRDERVDDKFGKMDSFSQMIESTGRQEVLHDQEVLS